LKEKVNSRRLRAVRVANAVNKVEGVRISDSARNLSVQWVQGKITGKAMKTVLITKHTQNPGI